MKKIKSRRSVFSRPSPTLEGLRTREGIPAGGHLVLCGTPHSAQDLKFQNTMDGWHQFEMDHHELFERIRGLNQTPSAPMHTWLPLNARVLPSISNLKRWFRHVEKRWPSTHRTKDDFPGA